MYLITIYVQLSREQVEQAANALMQPDQTYPMMTDEEFKVKLLRYITSKEVPKFRGEKIPVQKLFKIVLKMGGFASVMEQDYNSQKAESIWEDIYKQMSGTVPNPRIAKMLQTNNMFAMMYQEFVRDAIWHQANRGAELPDDYWYRFMDQLYDIHQLE